jgi:hypothetical protein
MRKILFLALFSVMFSTSASFIFASEDKEVKHGLSISPRDIESLWAGLAQNTVFQKYLADNSSERTTAEAVIKLNTYDREFLRTSYDFQTLQAEKNISGWNNQENFYFWNGKDVAVKPLSLMAGLEGIAAPLSLYKFNAIWLDYSVPSVAAGCKPSISLSGTSKKFGSNNAPTETWAASTSEFLAGTKTIVSEDIVNADGINSKNLFDFLGGYLNLGNKQEWVVKKLSNDRSLFNKNFNKNLFNIDEILIEPGPDAELSQVKVIVELGGRHIKEFTLVAPPKVSGDKGANPSLRFDLKKEVRDRYPELILPPVSTQNLAEREIIVLKEMSVSSSRDPVIESQKNKIFSVKFLSGNVGRILPSDSVTQGNGVFRMVVQLGQVAPRSEEFLRSMRVQIMPPATNESCGIRIQSARLVSTYYGKEPIYAKNLRDLSQKWGGPFIHQPLKYGQVEQPGVIAYFPLDFLEGKNPASIWRHSQGNQNSKLRLPFEAHAKKGTLLYIGERKGSESLGYLVVRFALPNGGYTKAYHVKPNRPINLFEDSINVVGVEIDLGDLPSNYSFNLNEVVLFNPIIVDYATARNVMIPHIESLDLTPAISAPNLKNFIINKPGEVKGVIPQKGKLEFAVDIPSSMTVVSGVTLEHKFDKTFFGADGCPIKLLFHYSRGTYQQDYCPALGFDQSFIPTVHAGNNSKTPINLGPLKSIGWVLQGGDVGRASEQMFHIKFKIWGVGQTSFIQQFASFPVFNLGSQEIKPDIKALQKEFKLSDSTGSSEVEVQTNNFPIGDLTNFPKIASGNDFYKIQKINFDITLPFQISLDSKNSQNPYTLKKIFKVLAIIILLVLMASIFYFKYLYIKKVFQNLLKITKDFCNKFSNEFFIFIFSISYLLSVLLLIYAVFYIFNNHGNTHQGWLMVYFSLIINFVALNLIINKFIKRVLDDQYVNLIILCMNLMVTVYTLIRYGFYDYIYMLLISWIFVFLLFFRDKIFKSWRFLNLSFWLFVTCILYSKGLKYFPVGENYYYSFAALCAALLFRLSFEYLIAGFGKCNLRISPYIARLVGKSGYIVAFLLFVSEPMLLLGGYHKTAEEVAVIAFFSLLINLAEEVFRLIYSKYKNR